MDGQNQIPPNPPGRQDALPPQPVASATETLVNPQAQVPAPTTLPTTAPFAPVAPSPAVDLPAVTIDAPEQPRAFTADTTDDNPYEVPANDLPPARQEVTWAAPEFVAHAKNQAWYMGLAGITVVGVVVGYLITKDIFTAVIIIICGILFGYTAARQPRTVEYALGPKGISIGQKFYAYMDYSGFSVHDEGTLATIDFMPLKRFAPILTVAFNPADEQEVLEVLTQHIPMASHKRTLTDDMMRRVRF